MTFNEQKILDIKKWLQGVIISAMLPFLVAIFSWAADDFSKKLFEYFPYIDALLLLYAAALNCFILTEELEGVHKNKILEAITRLFSFALASLSALFYVFLMGKEKINYANIILIGILVGTILNLIGGTIYILCDYKKDFGEKIEPNYLSANTSEQKEHSVKIETDSETKKDA